MKSRTATNMKNVFFSLFKVFLLTEIISSISSFLDGIFVGQMLNAQSLSAISLGKPVFLFAKSISVLLATGGMLSYTNYIGQNNKKAADGILSVVLRICFIGGFGITLLACGFSGKIIELSGVSQDAELFASARNYLIGRGLGILPYMLSTVLMSMLKIFDGKKYVTASAIVTGISNVVMDYLFLSFTHWGMFGVGLATALSYLLSAIVCSSFFLIRKGSFRFVRCARPLQELKNIAVYGSAATLMRICSTISVYAVNKLMLNVGGGDYLTAYAIWTNLIDLFAAGALASMMACSAMIALYRGERDKVQMKNTLSFSLRFTLLFNLASSIFILIFLRRISALFGIAENTSVFEVVRYMIICFAPFFLLPNGAVMVLSGYYSAIKKMMLANMMMLMQKIIFLLPCMWLLSRIQAKLIWWALPITEVLILISMIIIEGIPIKRVPRLGNFVNSAFNPDIPEEMTYSVTLENDFSRIVSVSQKLQRFCMERGIDHRRSSFVALAAEEMMTLTVNHAFTPGKKHLIDILVIIENETLFVCFRNDGIEMNPMDFYEKYAEDQFAGVGIRLIKGITKEQRYHYMYNMNHLTMVC